MKKPIFIFGWLLATMILSCHKNSNQTPENNSSLLGKWTLVATLADPGDGSGKWTAVDKPNYYYLQFYADNTFKTSSLTGSGSVEKFKVINDSMINFIYGNGQKILNSYRIDNSSLTLTGGCIEACGAKYIRGNE